MTFSGVTTIETSGIRFITFWTRKNVRFVALKSVLQFRRSRYQRLEREKKRKTVCLTYDDRFYALTTVGLGCHDNELVSFAFEFEICSSCLLSLFLLSLPQSSSSSDDDDEVLFAKHVSHSL
jgi:hypothetical protein